MILFYKNNYHNDYSSIIYEKYDNIIRNISNTIENNLNINLNLQNILQNIKLIYGFQYYDNYNSKALLDKKQLYHHNLNLMMEYADLLVKLGIKYNQNSNVIFYNIVKIKFIQFYHAFYNKPIIENNVDYFYNIHNHHNETYNELNVLLHFLTHGNENFFNNVSSIININPIKIQNFIIGLLYTGNDQDNRKHLVANIVHQEFLQSFLYFNRYTQQCRVIVNLANNKILRDIYLHGDVYHKEDRQATNNIFKMHVGINYNITNSLNVSSYLNDICDILIGGQVAWESNHHFDGVFNIKIQISKLVIYVVYSIKKKWSCILFINPKIDIREQFKNINDDFAVKTHKIPQNLTEYNLEI